MRRQFLRVYLGIALVLVLAAAATTWLVAREFREGLKQRYEHAMSSRAQHIKERVLRVAAGRRAQAVADMQKLFGYAIELRPVRQLDLADDAALDFGGGRPVFVSSDGGRLVAVDLDGESALVMGPFEGRFRPRGGWPWWRFREYFLVGSLLGILAIVGAAVFVLLKPFERRIVALTEVAQDFGEGKLERRSDDGRNDAIGALATTFNNMADRIGGLIERQRELLHAVSHEFRTPLARLFFIVDDAQGATDAAEKDRQLQKIEGSLQDLNDLVEELLTFVRLEEGGEEVAKEMVDVASQVADVALVVDDLRGDIGLRVEGERLEVPGVPHLCKRAALNLVTNALRYAKSQVVVRCQREGEWVQVVVDDDGPGIPAAARSQVLQPFFRVDTSRTADSGGCGLGL
ncbi:MAG: ATP-binding protein, partial [Candidatus Latescibacteria bacterium]|nr:ATP-binding protein [Candidatus Latescibacterota bacterium]